jgi:RimJ/RimL family protein N-acetyltransferase
VGECTKKPPKLAACVTLQNNANNRVSSVLAKRAGYHLDGIMRQSIMNEDGTFDDLMVWSKLKSDYRPYK